MKLVNKNKKLEVILYKFKNFIHIRLKNLIYDEEW